MRPESRTNDVHPRTPLSHLDQDQLQHAISKQIAPFAEESGRGERDPDTVEIGPRHGSSPRARGTPDLDKRFFVYIRVIPAGTGNASWSQASPCRRPGHPRGHGERLKLKPGSDNVVGSSPRARGTLPDAFDRRLVARVIPAGAGNADPRVGGGERAAGHPRGRGERALLPVIAEVGYGSSPRARGTRCLQSLQSTPPRVIPAGAGNAVTTSSGRFSVKGHPRGHGERISSIRAAASSCGSSPRAPGTRRVDDQPGTPSRLIPAGTGNARVSTVATR